jgi:beta-glucosidase
LYNSIIELKKITKRIDNLIVLRIFAGKFINSTQFMKKTILSMTMICAATMVLAQKPAIPSDAAL